MDINDCTTERTKSMLENLRALGYAIELEVAPERFAENENCWGMEPVYKILAPNETIDKAAFTHELLHIYLYSLGFVGDEVLRKVVDENGTIFSAELLFR